MTATVPLVVAGWQFAAPPAGWEAVPGAGLLRNEPGHFPSNVAISSEPLPEGSSLATWVEGQHALMRSRLSEPRFEGPSPASLAGAEEAVSLGIEHAVDGGTRIHQRQIYARHGRKVSIFTFTTDGTDSREVEAEFDGILRGLSRLG
jgi:hypothetical protein